MLKPCYNYHLCVHAWSDPLSPPSAPLQKTSSKGGVEKLTDTSQYTGSHKERFDAEGKGKGLEGRKDMSKNTGYVGAFKGDGTYDKTH